MGDGIATQAGMVPQAAGGGITLVSRAVSSSNLNNSTSVLVDSSLGDLVVVAVASYQKSISSIADSEGNTWTALSEIVSGNSRIRIFYCFAPAVSSSHSFSFSSSSSFPSIAVSCFSGASSFEEEVSSTYTGVTSGDLVVSSSIADSVFVGSGNLFQSSGITSSNLDLIVKNWTVGGDSVAIAQGYFLGATPITGDFSWTGSVNGFAFAGAVFT